MEQVQVRANIPQQDADSVFESLRDFGAYPRLCGSVRNVEVEKTGTNEILSSWEVNFQSGILKWQERDVFDPAKREIRFEQTVGDLDHFSGYWRVSEHGADSEVCFTANFDLGIPMLADMLDPIAKRAIEENIQSIISGLFFSEQVAGVA